MATTQAAALVEKSIGHRDDSITAQDITNPDRDRAKYGHPTEKMKALCWMGKNNIQVLEVPKPIVVEDRDVILKVTGSTVCGSDLHLLHGTVVEMEKGDILGHEFCGIIESMGSQVKGLKEGDRVVASFQIACGNVSAATTQDLKFRLTRRLLHQCMYCDRKLSSQCEKTNSNKLEYGMYGGNTAGMFGYSHFTGGFAGGQAEYVRVPLGDVNLLKLPDSVPDEKGTCLDRLLPYQYSTHGPGLRSAHLDDQNYADSWLRSVPVRCPSDFVELCRRHRCQ